MPVLIKYKELVLRKFIANVKERSLQSDGSASCWFKKN